jgi:DNA-binding XRE family transcriptional regulator
LKEGDKMSLLNLKKKRKENNYTQQAVSEIIKVSLSTYKKYEQGSREPGLETVKQLSILFKCKVDDLF